MWMFKKIRMFMRNDSIQFTNTVGNANENLSNALLKSVYTQSTSFFDSNELEKLENSNRLEVVDLALMQPCWWLEITLQQSCLIKLQTIFSKTLGMLESSAIGL